MTPPNAYLEGLNERQREAVSHSSAPLLILAGAGSGKTRVITSRMAHLIYQERFYPSEILGVTFTNKAAAEMRERVHTLLQPLSSDSPHQTFLNLPMLKTFHSFGAWFLRRYGESIGLKQNFTIFDETDSLALLKEVQPYALPKSELKYFASLISRAKEEGLTAESNLSHLTHRSELGELYRLYTKALRSIGNVDFGDLISLPTQILAKFPVVKETLHRRFRAILIDEYQDTNVAQDLLLRELFHENCWLSVVGDDDQSIYRFRGAVVENILTFPQRYSSAKVIALQENYRSTGHIIQAAESVIKNNKHRSQKEMKPVRELGKPITLSHFENGDEEALFCGRLLKTLPAGESAGVLYRTNAQSRAFEKSFTYLQIPHRLVGGVSFFRRQEVKDGLALLALLGNPNDYIAFMRVVNRPSRGLGPRSLQEILNELDANEGDILKAASEAVKSFKGKRKKGLTEFLNLFERVKTTTFDNLGEMLTFLIRESGLLALYQEFDSEERTDRVANLEELIQSALEYGVSEEERSLFLEAMELNSEERSEDESEPPISLITVHNTKGLEFDWVIITGMEEGLFPSSQSESKEDEEEERRLFYVAMTRARTRLFITYTSYRFHFGMHRHNSPSRFLEEIPPESLASFDDDGETNDRTEAILPKSRELRLPSTFENHPPSFAQIAQKKQKFKEGEKGLLFPKGSKVYHDDFGEGYVQKSSLKKGMEVVIIGFLTGKRATFIPELQPSSLTKIEEEW